MDSHIARQFGFLLAAQARVFGMVAANEAAKARGCVVPVHDEDDFNQEAAAIEAIARNI